jgi:hypothetical protein
MSLYFVNPADLKTKFEIPKEATADVTLRRLQSFRLKPDQTFHWNFGTNKGEAKSDAQGLVTIPALKMTAAPTTLTVTP